MIMYINCRHTRILDVYYLRDVSLMFQDTFVLGSSFDAHVSPRGFFRQYVINIDESLEGSWVSHQCKTHQSKILSFMASQMMRPNVWFRNMLINLLVTVFAPSCGSLSRSVSKEAVKRVFFRTKNKPETSQAVKVTLSCEQSEWGEV